ncbi:MAG: hypothetical protein AB7U23_10115 [Dehalococcoidia bacterium]
MDNIEQKAAAAVADPEATVIDLERVATLLEERGRLYAEAAELNARRDALKAEARDANARVAAVDAELLELLPSTPGVTVFADGVVDIDNVLARAMQVVEGDEVSDAAKQVLRGLLDSLGEAKRVPGGKSAGS